MSNIAETLYGIVAVLYFGFVILPVLFVLEVYYTIRNLGKQN